jgi:hypothetical protein
MNLLNNGSFEGGWYHKDGKPEWQIPKKWWFVSKTDESNPFNPAPDGQFIDPEVRVLPKTQLPDYEQRLFVLDGEHTLKAFTDWKSWYGHFGQEIPVENIGKYRLTIRVYADAIKHYENSKKIWATDPKSALIKFRCNGQLSDFASLIPGTWNNLAFEFWAKDRARMAIEFMFPFPLRNCGIFADKWSLEYLPKPLGSAREDYERDFNLLHWTLTDEEAVEIFRKNRRQTYGQSWDDAGMSGTSINRIKAHGFPIEKEEPTKNWFKRFYPNADITFVREPRPDPILPPARVGELLTLHKQTNVQGWIEYIRDVKPAWVKLVGDFQSASVVKAVSPYTNILIRHVIDHQSPFYETDDYSGAANAFLDTFWSNVVDIPQIDAIEGLNEEIPTNNPEKLEKVLKFEMALSDEVKKRSKELGRHITLVMLNAAVGNPGHNEMITLLPVAEKAIAHNHAIGYHSYFPCHPEYAEKWFDEYAIDYHLRGVLSMQKLFLDRGLPVRLFHTEGGAVESTPVNGQPGPLNAGGGWKRCLNGNLIRYIELLLRLRERMDTSEMMAIFTTAHDYVGWKEFAFNTKEMYELSQVL